VDPLKPRNLHILKLRGTREERAKQHALEVAKLSGEERAGLAAHPLSRKNQILIERAGARFPGGGRWIASIYEALVWQRSLRLPKTYRSRIAPFIRHSGISKKTLWLALFQPDFLMVLAASATPRNRNRFLQGLPGCSTVRVFSADGVRFIRNLDYPAASYWERHPAICYHEPTDPGLLKHVSITSLGIPTSGLTGWNEAGIALSLHAHFSKKVSLRGVPIFFLGEDILEKARTLDEAIALCKQFNPMGSWALNLSSFGENRHVTVELVGGEIRVREPDERAGIAHTNDFQHPDFEKDELHFCRDFKEDCVARREALLHLARKLSPEFTWEKAFSELSSHREAGSGKVRVCGNTASLVTTIQTLGFDPVSDRIYLSLRNETPVTHGPFAILPRSLDGIGTEAAPPLLEIPDRHGEGFMKALHFYHHAYVSWQVRGEPARVAHAFLLQAKEAFPSDSHLLLQLGYFQLVSIEASQALLTFRQALGLQDLGSHHRDLATYFEGASLDLLGQREEALQAYQRITGRAGVDPGLLKKAKNRLNRPFTKRDCKRIEPDLQFVEPLNHP
jgi:hypothetical protein